MTNMERVRQKRIDLAPVLDPFMDDPTGVYAFVWQELWELMATNDLVQLEFMFDFCILVSEGNISKADFEEIVITGRDQGYLNLCSTLKKGIKQYSYNRHDIAIDPARNPVLNGVPLY